MHCIALHWCGLDWFSLEEGGARRLFYHPNHLITESSAAMVGSPLHWNRKFVHRWQYFWVVWDFLSFLCNYHFKYYNVSDIPVDRWYHLYGSAWHTHEGKKWWFWEHHQTVASDCSRHKQKKNLIKSFSTTRTGRVRVQDEVLAASDTSCWRGAKTLAFVMASFLPNKREMVEGQS